jgi:ABC-type protease/lipase transport system fused ATPase/permease subunit
MLSAGQQQRIGIARAIYGFPRVVVLDEPNANLDLAGEEALVSTVLQLQRKGCTVVVVTHRTNILQAVQKIALIVQGKLVRYGLRDEVIAATTKSASRAEPPALPRMQPAMPGPKS